MKALLSFCVCATTGYVLARLLSVDVSGSDVYVVVITALLACGLYGAAFGIDLAEARKHARLIATAVTIGVVLKAAMIGAVMWAFTGDGIALLLGIAVAQIDPLSVAAILENRRMSKTAKTILAVWASFDDPVTALLTVYGTVILADAFGSVPESASGGLTAFGVDTWTQSLVSNVVLAAVAYLLWRALGVWSRRGDRAVSATALIAVVAVAVDRFLMLGVAVTGLFFRPAIAVAVERCLSVAVLIAAGMIGMMLVPGVDVWGGIVLGVTTFTSQVVVGMLLTRGLASHDRWHLAFAQQNGLTAIVLALLLEVQYDGIVAVVAPAVVVVNIIHTVANAQLDRLMPAGSQPTQPHLVTQR